MKRAKRLISVMLAAVMALAMGMTAFADGTDEVTGSITIQQTASSDGKTTVSVAGRTFSAYKVLDVTSYTDAVVDDEGNVTTEAAVVYTVPEGLKKFYAAKYSVEESAGDFDYQVVEKIRAETDLFAFAAAVLKAAKGETDNTVSPALPGANPVITPVSETAGADASEVTIPNLPLGYYVIEDTGTKTPVSALLLDTVTPDVTVSIKADVPSLDKKIDGAADTDEGTTGDTAYNNAAVGDKIPFRLTTGVPDMTGYRSYQFMITDTLSGGLTFNDDVSITIGKEASAATLLRVYGKTESDGSVVYYKSYSIDGSGQESYSDPVGDGDSTYRYTVETGTDADTGETKLEIVFFDFIQYRYSENEGTESGYQAGTPITVTYSATLNGDAVIGTEGNPNTAKLIYSNDPGKTTEGMPDKPGEGSPVGETPESETYTYVTGIELIKVDQDNKRLTGAEFQLEGTKLNTVLVRTEAFTEAENGEYWKLKDGSYTSTAPVTADDETDTSALYESTTQKYDKTITTTPIEKAENVTYTGTVGEDGALRFDGLSAGSYTITELKAPAGYNLLKNPVNITIAFTAPAEGSDVCAWTYTGTDEVNGTNVNRITVLNQAGTELPSTGGAGTTVFYLLGAVLVLGAGILLAVKRWMGSGR